MAPAQSGAWVRVTSPSIATESTIYLIPYSYVTHVAFLCCRSMAGRVAEGCLSDFLQFIFFLFLPPRHHLHPLSPSPLRSFSVVGFPTGWGEGDRLLFPFPPPPKIYTSSKFSNSSVPPVSHIIETQAANLLTSQNMWKNFSENPWHPPTTMI